jgi:hypothetical protein
MAAADDTAIVDPIQGPVEILSLSLTAGEYAINAKTTVGTIGGFLNVSCELKLGDTVLDESLALVPGPFPATTLPLASTATLAADGTVGLSCRSNGAVGQFLARRIVAVKVGAVH